MRGLADWSEDFLTELESKLGVEGDSQEVQALQVSDVSEWCCELACSATCRWVRQRCQ